MYYYKDIEIDTDHTDLPISEYGIRRGFIEHDGNKPVEISNLRNSGGKWTADLESLWPLRILYPMLILAPNKQSILGVVFTLNKPEYHSQQIGTHSETFVE